MSKEQELVNQTNRTILFAKLNGKKDNLYQFLSGGIVDDELIKSINESLVVESFDDFLEKFQPSIYLNVIDQNGIPFFDYNLEERGNGRPLMKGNAVIDMLLQLIESRKSGGKKNVDFDFEKLLELISPKQTSKNISKIRKDLDYLEKEYQKLPEGSPKRKEIGAKLNRIFVNNRENYQNLISLLEILISDIQNTQEQLKKITSGTDTGEKMLPCKIGFDPNGDIELKMIAAPQDQPQGENEMPSQSSIPAAIQDDYREQASVRNFEPNEFVVQTLMRVFSPNEIGTPIELTEQKKKQHDKYLEFSKSEKISFFKSVTPLLQTILGVKLFFDQYQEGHKGNEAKPKLLISNCAAGDFASDEGKNRLHEYLKAVNSVTDSENTIWFGIVPSVSTLKNEKISENTGGPFESNMTEELRDKSVNCDLDELSILQSIMKDHKIVTFFSFKPERDNCFSKIGAKKLDTIREMTKQIENDPKSSKYMVHCLPNFTILDEGKRVKLGTRMVETGEVDEKNRDEYVPIPGIFVDAAYIAAGLTAAWQSPTFLKKRFPGKNAVTLEYPGVRFDIEKNENALNLYTSMPREITGYTDLKDELNKLPYGYFFSSDNYYSDNDSIPKGRIFVFKARTMAKNKEFEKYGYKQLYKVINETYLSRLITNYCNGKVVVSSVEEMLGDVEGAMKIHWKKNENYLNGIIQTGDEISFNKHTQKIDIRYIDVEETIDIEINEE
jgi:hypothetical protein